MRRAWLALALLPLACAERPDVLLVTVDTLRADRLHAYGYPLETSPRLDALAAEGVLFERAIAASSATVPSHASIMTSLYPRQHSVGYLNGGSLLEAREPLAERFRGAGWRTGAFVGNLVLHRRTGLSTGFEVYDDEFDRREVNRGVFERVAERTTERALAWLEEAADEPVFLWVHYQDPHGPYAPPEPASGRFRIEPRAGEEPLPIVEGPSGRGGVPDYQALPGLSLPSEYEARYADEIFYADRWIGELIDGFDARPGDGIVLVTADHGESLGEHGRWFVHFWTSTPENAHVPFLLRAPGIAPARRGEVVSHVDVAPTLLELAGLPAPAEARGIALGPLLRGEEPAPDRVVFCDAGRELTGYRGDRFLRLDGTLGAWKTAQASGPPPDRGRFYAWRADGSWRQVRREAPADARITRYAASARPMVRAPQLDRETIERLRALGYGVE